MPTRPSGTLNLKPPGVLVYSVFSWSGSLLYVGITGDLCRGFAAHRWESDWWENASRVEWEEFPDRRSALREEGRLIMDLRPPFNVAGACGTTPFVGPLVPPPQPSYEEREEAAVMAHRRFSPADRVPS